MSERTGRFLNGILQGRLPGNKDVSASRVGTKTATTFNLETIILYFLVKDRKLMRVAQKHFMMQVR